jgi:hypothetical protein
MSEDHRILSFHQEEDGVHEQHNHFNQSGQSKQSVHAVGLRDGIR